MPQYRKKPVVIEAVQYKAGAVLPDGVIMVPMSRFGSSMGDTPVIETLEGTLHVSDGDWIITGVQNEKYPCKPDIFEQTYEPV